MEQNIEQKSSEWMQPYTWGPKATQGEAIVKTYNDRMNVTEYMYVCVCVVNSC